MADRGGHQRELIKNPQQDYDDVDDDDDGDDGDDDDDDDDVHDDDNVHDDDEVHDDDDGNDGDGDDGVCAQMTIYWRHLACNPIAPGLSRWHAFLSHNRHHRHHGDPNSAFSPQKIRIKN